MKTKIEAMDFSAYHQYFESIVQKEPEDQIAPYDHPDYIDYTTMNYSRMNRWLKTAEISPELAKILAGIKNARQWIVITEPWCGDAAHSVAIIELAARKNPLITVIYELRDAEPFRINQYLTRGTKSIPKLILRNSQGDDLGSWGPRPEACQAVYEQLIAEKADFEKTKIALQVWYNADKGKSIQQELLQLIQDIEGSS